MSYLPRGFSPYQRSSRLWSLSRHILLPRTGLPVNSLTVEEIVHDFW